MAGHRGGEVYEVGGLAVHVVADGAISAAAEAVDESSERSEAQTHDGCVVEGGISDCWLILNAASPRARV